MSQAPPKDHLMGCRLCGAILAVAEMDDRLPDHALGGRRFEAECPGSGDPGLPLGLKDWYQLEPGVVVLMGGARNASIRVQCTECGEQFSMPAPGEGAFNRRLSIETKCRRCAGYVRLADLREGPTGVMVPRSNTESW